MAKERYDKACPSCGALHFKYSAQDETIEIIDDSFDEKKSNRDSSTP